MSIQSPKHRIQRLKKEIEHLDHQMKASSPPKRSFNLPLSFLTPQPEREEIQQKINSLRATAISKEQTLSTQLKGIQQNLRASAIKKQNELGSCKSYREALKKRMEVLKSNLQKYSDDYTIISTSLEEKKRIIENSSVAKAIVYSESLVPLESDAKVLENLKKDLDGKMNELEEQETLHMNRIKMCREEWLMKNLMKLETIAMREESEARLDLFFYEFHDEIEFFEEEDEYFRKILHVNSLQNKYKEEVTRLDSSFGSLLVHADRIKRRLEKVNEEMRALILTSADIKISNEIEKIENLLKTKCESFGAESFENLVFELNCIEGFDIDEEILKLQLNEIKFIETSLRQEFEFEETSFSESLIIRNYAKGTTDDLAEQFHKKKLRFRNRIAAITQWKEEVEDILSDFIPKTDVFLKDKSVIQEFLAGLAKLPPDLRKEIEATVTNLVTKLTNRDKSLQSQFMNLREKQIEKNRLIDKLQKINIELYRTQLDILRAKQQVQVLIEKERNLKQEYRNSDQNTIIINLLRLKSQISYFDNLHTSYSKSIEITSQIFTDLQDSSKSIKREITLCKLSISEASDDLKTIQYQIEKINDKKSKNLMTPAKSLDEEKLIMLQVKIEETSAELSSCQVEFSNFETEYQMKLSLIEQEESILRSQQQAIESALRNIEIDAKRIQEMESQLDQIDENSVSALVSGSRSKSTAKIQKVRVDEIYKNEIRDGDEGSSIVEGNQFLELVVKPLGRVPISTDRSLSRAINKKYYRFNLEDISQTEVNFLEKIRPLLEGTEILKKFVTKSKIKNFDILDSLNLMPEHCGFAVRHFFLHKTLTKIEVKQPLKPGFESTIPTESLWGPLLPPNVLLVLKAQGHLNSDDLDYDKLNEKMKDSVSFDVNSERFKELCCGINLYPFSISFVHGEKIDLVAKGYSVLKQWVNGINALTKYKKYIPKLRSRIETYTTV